MSARFSATVLPVIVSASPCRCPGVEQHLHHHRHAANPIQVGHVEPAARLHIGDVGHLSGDAVEVVELEVDLGLVGDRQQVQHGVGRPRRAPR
jgi:hypothetical protein